MCTSFAVYGQKKAVYGMTFDTDEIDLKLKVRSYKLNFPSKHFQIKPV